MHRRLEIGAEARDLLRPARVVRRSAAPELHAEAAQVVALAAVAVVEARQVDVLAADAVVILRRRAEQLGHKAEHVQPHLLAQIPADHVGRIADAVRVADDFEFSRMRVESMQDAATITTRARTVRSSLV